MNAKFRDYIFFWICFLTPWDGMNPWLFQWWGKVWGPLNGNLVVYPLTIGIIYSLYLQYKGKNVFLYNKWIVAFFVCSMLVEFITIVHGASIFPYWEMIDTASIPMRIQNTYIGALFQGSGSVLSYGSLNRIYLLSYLVKEAFICATTLWGGAYMIYCWYRNDYKRAVSIMGKAVMVSTAILLVYCLIELFALCGNVFFSRLLEKMDFVLHPQYKDWLLHWTLLARQMRGFFTEPSHFGMYAGVMCAFLWYKIFTEKSKLAIIGNVILSFYVVLTSSRAAVGIYCVMLISLIVIIIYKHEKNLFKGGTIIFLSAIISFFAGTYVIKTVILPQTVHPRLYITGDMYGYLQSNLGSLTEVNARSNGARYAYAYAALKTGYEHPYLGVGKRFYTLYAIENIPEWGRNNKEVIMCVNRQKKEALDNTFPVINWYCELFATRGILGLVWYLFPFAFAMWKMINMLKMHSGEIEQECFLFLELFLVVALWGVNNSAPSLYYTTWVLLGLSFLIIDEEKKYFCNN